MEKNPLSLPEAEYAAKRQALLEELKDDPQRAAVFMLLENLWKLEQTQGETRHEITWGYRETTQVLLSYVLNGGADSIPMPDKRLGHTYEPFDWRTRKPYSRLDSDWLNMRIMRGRMNGTDHLTLRANLGQLSIYKNDVIGLVDQIPYPIHVLDNSGFRFENAALRATHQE